MRLHAQLCNYGLQKEYSVFHSPCNLRVEPQRMCIVHTAAELPACIRFSCCSPLASASAAFPIASALLLLPDCVRFNSAPQWHPLCLLLPDWSASHRIDYQPPKYTHKQRDRAIGSGSVWLTDMYKGGPHNIHSPEWSHTRTHTHTLFGCSTPAVLEDSGHVHYSRIFFVEFEVQSMKVACHYSLVPSHKHPTSVAHRQTDTRLKS